MAREAQGPSAQEILGPASSRPIMTAGIFLLAAVALAIVVLVPLLAIPVNEVRGPNPWAMASVLVLCYCVPCIAGIVFVIMRKISIRRPLRYAMAGVSFAAMSLVGCVAVMACFSGPGTESARIMTYGLQEVFVRGWWVMALLGLALGLSLPVGGHGADDVVPTEYPLRRRVMGALLVCAWLGVAYQLMYHFLPPALGAHVHSAVTAYLDQSVAAPTVAFFGCAFVTAQLWLRSTLKLGRWLFAVLFWVPLAVLAAAVVLTVMDLTRLYGSFSLTYAAYRISGVFVLRMCLLGIMLGVGVSGIEH